MWQIKGDADLARLLAAAQLVGLQQPNRGPLPEGTASLDLSIANNWAGFGAPLLTGTAQLRRVKTQLPEIAAPVEIASASLLLSPQEVTIQKLSAALIGTRAQFDGSLAIPRICNEQPCPVRFDLHASELNLDDVNRLLNPKFQPTNWLGQKAAIAPGGSSKLFDIDLIGQLAADRLIMKGLVATNVIAHVAKDNGMVTLTDVRADLLGGKHRGTWRGELHAAGRRRRLRVRFAGAKGARPFHRLWRHDSRHGARRVLAGCSRQDQNRKSAGR